MTKKFLHAKFIKPWPTLSSTQRNFEFRMGNSQQPLRDQRNFKRRSIRPRNSNRRARPPRFFPFAKFFISGRLKQRRRRGFRRSRSRGSYSSARKLYLSGDGERIEVFHFSRSRDIYFSCACNSTTKLVSGNKKVGVARAR